MKYIRENQELFDCLCQLMIKFASLVEDKTRPRQINDDETILSLANILWSVSFHKCYHEKFLVA